MEIGTEKPAIIVEPAEDPFEVDVPEETEVERPVETPVEVPEEVPA